MKNFCIDINPIRIKKHSPKEVVYKFEICKLFISEMTTVLTIFNISFGLWTGRTKGVYYKGSILKRRKKSHAIKR